MPHTRFSQRLSYLMKERKISGQRIGDAIGKSQKTISRYANGEVDPSTDIKNMIYRVIADISGIEEDATTEEQLSEQEWLWENEWTETEIQMGRVTQEEEIESFECLSSAFDELSIGAKNYYIKNIQKFHLMEDWEYEVMYIYRSLPAHKQKKFLQFFEPFNFTFSSMYNMRKMAAYMEMIEISERRPVIIKEKVSEIDAIQAEKLKEEWIDKISEMEWGEDSSCYKYWYTPAYPDFLSYTPHDWYVLLRIQIFELNDEEKVHWGDEHGELALGSKLYSIMMSIEQGSF